MLTYVSEACRKAFYSSARDLGPGWFRFSRDALRRGPHSRIRDIVTRELCAVRQGLY